MANNAIRTRLHSVRFGMLASGTIHALIVLSFFRPEHWWHKTETPVRPKPVEISYQESMPGFDRLGPQAKGRSHSTRAKQKRTFIPKYKWNESEGLKFSSEDSVEFDGTGADDVDIGDRRSWGGGNQPMKFVDGAQTYSYILKKLEGITVYPSLLRYKDIEGTVNVRLAWTDAGRCDLKKTWVNGENKWLRLYVLSRLHSLCREDFSHLVRKTRSPFVDLSFEFRFVEAVEKRHKPIETSVVGRVALIGVFEERTKLTIPLGPIRLDPLYAMVRVDFEWLQRNYEKYIEGRDPFDELERDLQREISSQGTAPVAM